MLRRSKESFCFVDVLQRLTAASHHQACEQRSRRTGSLSLSPQNLFWLNANSSLLYPNAIPAKDWQTVLNENSIAIYCILLFCVATATMTKGKTQEKCMCLRMSCCGAPVTPGERPGEKINTVREPGTGGLGSLVEQLL